MWCPNCKAEYEKGIETCADCNLALVEGFPLDTPKEKWGRAFPGKAMKAWPFTESGKPEPPAFIKHCTSVDMEDEMLINMLYAYGIPAIKQYPENGQLGKVVLGISGDGADIFVPSSMLEDAKALIGGASND